jgi:2-iminobutanoate/2-iminopropanoate deaminase
MHVLHNPDTVVPPLSNYTQAVEVPAGARWLYLSGQVGIDVDGTAGDGFVAQCDIAWKHVLNLLEAGGMGPEDVVKITVYLTRTEDLVAYREGRDRALGENKPASTLIIISSLARPNLLVEIEAVAAKA